MIFKRKEKICNPLMEESLEQTRRAIAVAEKLASENKKLKLELENKNKIIEDLKDLYNSSIDEVFNEHDYRHNNDIWDVWLDLHCRIAHKCSQQITKWPSEEDKET